MTTTRRTLHRRSLGGIAMVLLAGVLVFSACSDDGGDDAGTNPGNDRSSPVAQATPEATTAPPSSDSTAICAIFNELTASGAGPGAQFQATTPEGWARRIATNERIVAAAPAEWRDEAEAYLQMVKDRAQLAAGNGYVGVDDLPADVRNAFIASHRAMQAEVNELIAFMSTECTAPASG